MLEPESTQFIEMNRRDRVHEMLGDVLDYFGCLRSGRPLPLLTISAQVLLISGWLVNQVWASMMAFSVFNSLAI